MSSLLSYREMKLLYGKDDRQVIAIRAHLDNLNPNNDADADAHNHTLRAFIRLTTN